MLNKILDIFSILFGTIFIIFNKPISQYAVNAWRKRINIAVPSETIYRIFCLVVGIIFVALGILSLLGVIKSK